ncbi:MAG: transposase, partial [Bacillota bacterium]
MELQSKTRLQLIFEKIDLTEVAKSIESDSTKGPNGYNSKSIVKAFLAQQIENIPNRAALVRRLKGDPVFRFSCGFKVTGKVPSEATLSRYYNKLTEEDSLEKL